MALDKETTERIHSNPRWNWKTGYGPPFGLLINPRPWKVHHLVGDFYEKDLRRAVWGYALIAAFIASPVVIGVISGFVERLLPRWHDWVETIALLVLMVMTLVGLTGMALKSFDTEPPEKVTLRLPLKEAE